MGTDFSWFWSIALYLQNPHKKRFTKLSRMVSVRALMGLVPNIKQIQQGLQMFFFLAFLSFLKFKMAV